MRALVYTGTQLSEIRDVPAPVCDRQKIVVDLIAEKTNGAERIFCLPDGVQPDQLQALTLGWLQRDATDLDYAATLLIWGAMKDAYSCS